MKTAKIEHNRWEGGRFMDEERMEEKVHNVDDFIGKVDWYR